MIHSESNPPVLNTPWYPKYQSPKAHGMNHPLFIPVGQSPQSPRTGAVPGRVVPWPGFNVWDIAPKSYIIWYYHTSSYIILVYFSYQFHPFFDSRCFF